MAQVRARALKGGVRAADIERRGLIVLPHVSVEVALYAVLLVAASVLRLYALGRQPLEHGEAQMAWAVWRFYRGQAGAGVAYAPLLFFGNVLAFLVFDAGDATARLVPAIFGIVLVALPYFFRRWLGRWGALAASTLLVVSPSVVFFSRSLSPAIPAVTMALAFVAALLRYLETQGERYLYAAAVALALALAAGPAIYTVLVAMAAVALIALLRNRWGRSPDRAPLAQPETGQKRQDNPQSARLPGVARNPQFARSLALLAVTFALVSTGFLADYRGLQASLDLFARWLRGFSPGGGLGSLYLARVLLSYELLPLVFGVIGVYLAWQRNLLATLLTVWFGLALLMYSAAGAKEPADVLVILVPLILLAGVSIGRLLEAVADKATLEIEGFLALLVMAVAGFLYFQLAGYAVRGQPGFSRLSLGAVIVLIGLMAVFVYWSGWGSALRGGGLATLILLGALLSRVSFNLNLRWPDEPVELLRPRSTSSDVKHLVHLLEGLSNDRERYRYSIGITAEKSLAPILPWYLRSFEQVRFADVMRDTPNTPVVIVPVEMNPPLREGTIGQRFRFETSWQFSATSWRDRWRWYLFRLPPTEPLARDVVLYVGR